MKRVSLSCIGPILLVALVMIAGGAQAQTLNYWFAVKGDPTGTPLTSMDVAPGASFDVSLWYQTSDSWLHNAMEILVGYDRAASQGTSAIPLDGQITLLGGVSNISFPIILANNIGGGYSSTTGDRAYGVHLALGAALGTTLNASSPARVCDINLKNEAIPLGGYYDIGVYSAGTGNAWTTFAILETAYRRNVSPGTLRVDSKSVVYNPTTIDAAKKADGGENVSLSGMTVSASFPDSTGQFGFAVEELDRFSGIGVISSTAVAPGDIVTVKGTLATVDGMRSIDATSGSVTVTSIGNPIPRALGMGNIRSGGGTYGQQGAVVDVAPDRMAVGANTIGLLVTIWGKVTVSHDTGGYDGYFYVDDGSNLQDGSGNIGVKCRPAPGVAMPSQNSFAAVEGVMGTHVIGGKNARFLYTTSFRSF
ncbi:MAG: hypothetical protein M1133_02525 [Armatimonadetes bacterium]|nr:hypothetical protein [Armatimonadota bacterium]